MLVRWRHLAHAPFSRAFVSGGKRRFGNGVVFDGEFRNSPRSPLAEAITPLGPRFMPL